MRAWVDANTLLRFITKAPPEQAEESRSLLKRAEGGELVLRVHPLTVAETIWVLQSFYGYEKSRIARELGALLESSALAVADSKVVLSALSSMAESNVDYADAFLAELAKGQHEQVATFDADFDRLGVTRVAF